MLIEGKLPDSYARDAQFVEEFFTGVGNDTSSHYWIDKINDPELRKRLERLRNAREIPESLQRYYRQYTIVPVKSSDEIYLSVDPSKRKNSDVALSDCHYDAPFKYVPQCGNVFVRVILAITENSTTFTTIDDKTSILTTLEFNAMDYNRDYHCVQGYIPDGTVRILLKLHFLCVSPTSPQRCSEFTRYINDKWTHLSREAMRLSASPDNVIEKTIGYLIVVLSKMYNSSTPISSFLLIVLVYALICK